MNGILCIDKQAGISSFGVVAKARWVISKATGKKSKVGHAGTLDPFATGLLILLVGNATKHADKFLKLDKSYQATVHLGLNSTTADPEGEITPFSNHQPTNEEVTKTLEELSGTIEQTPPIFSAIKVNGQRAYHLARKGQAVELKPRKVTIYGYSNVSYEYPYINFTVDVSSGTYIRSLAVDIGNKLGTGAYLEKLRRTKVGKYSINDAHKLDSLDPENIAGKLLQIDNL